MNFLSLTTTNGSFILTDSFSISGKTFDRAGFRFLISAAGTMSSLMSTRTSASSDIKRRIMFCFSSRVENWYLFRALRTSAPLSIRTALPAAKLLRISVRKSRSSFLFWIRLVTPRKFKILFNRFLTRSINDGLWSSKSNSSGSEN